MKIFRFKHNGLNEWLEILLEAALLAIVLFFVFWPIRIEGPSMENTFSDGDRVVISRLLKYVNAFDRGDIIVCKIHLDNKMEHIIKRLIGLPGDRIEMKNGVVYVNGNSLDEDYTLDTTNSEVNILLLENQYFVLGDNRDISVDSRQLGPISKEAIIGKVILKIFPFTEIKAY